MGKVLHASGSGYFPTCIIDETTIIQPERYLNLTLEQAMALFWRVRTWEARASGSFVDGGLQLAAIEYTSNSFLEMTPTISVNEENSLVCKGAETFLFDRPATATITSTSGETIYVDTNITFQFSVLSIQKVGLSYYPRFLIETIGTLTSIFTHKIGTYKITYLNYDIVGDLFAQSAGSLGSALIEIRAKEYWSYGGTYNTSTGQLL
jgi:hypothetical protein